MDLDHLSMQIHAFHLKTSAVLANPIASDVRGRTLSRRARVAAVKARLDRIEGNQTQP
jgi:hypothetical protein